MMETYFGVSGVARLSAALSIPQIDLQEFEMNGDHVSYL